MHLQHTDPEGAVRVAMQMGVKRSVGVHWGTWLMSDEPCEFGFMPLFQVFAQLSTMCLSIRL
jgi:L-ascorbate metabolism protein UlaG (beta-lactamase superfamily)